MSQPLCQVLRTAEIVPGIEELMGKQEGGQWGVGQERGRYTNTKVSEETR